jgi:hypothetical protein
MKIGTAKPFDVIQGQQCFLQALLHYLQAVRDFNKAPEYAF